MPSTNSSSATAHQDLDVELPHIDGVLAATMALMTGYAEHLCEQGNKAHRHLMAQKIVSNLYELAAHPQMSKPLATVLRNLQGHWHTLIALGVLEDAAQTSDSPAVRAATATPSALWMPEHASVQ
jgi:hypothetical protein